MSHMHDGGGGGGGGDGSGEWSWWHYGLGAGAVIAVFAAVGFVSSGGQQPRTQHHKRSAKAKASGGRDDSPASRVSVRQTGAQTKSSDQEAKTLLKEAHEAKVAHKYRTAIAKYNKAAAHIKEATGESDHLFVGMIQQHIGSCYLSLEQYELAKYTYLDAIDILIKKKVEEDTIFDYRSRLAEALVYVGEYNDAERLLQESMAFFEQSETIGPNHIYMAIAKDTAQLLYRKKGEYELAIEYAMKAKAIFTAQLGAKDAFTMDCRLKLAELHSLAGMHDMAMQQVQEIWEDQKKWTSVKDALFVVQVALQQLLECGSVADAEKIADEYITVWSDDDDNLADRVSLSQIRWFLANIYWRDGRTEMAENALETIRGTPSSLILTTISRYFASKPNTRFSVHVDQNTSLPRFQYSIVLRVLQRDPPSAAQRMPPPGTVVEVQDDDAVPSASAESAPRLPAGALLVAEFESPDGEQVLPEVEHSIDDDALAHHGRDIVIKSAAFSSLRKRRYLATIKVYSDASRAELLDTHRQLINSSFDSEKASRSERAALFRKAEEERQHEQDDAKLLSVLEAKYGDKSTLDVALGKI